VLVRFFYLFKTPSKGVCYFRILVLLLAPLFCLSLLLVDFFVFVLILGQDQVIVSSSKFRIRDIIPHSLETDLESSLSVQDHTAIVIEAASDFEKSRIATFWAEFALDISGDCIARETL